MHQSLQGATFHLEHITPKSLGGESHADNLALACPSCNLHKGPAVTAIDPRTGTVPLFNPREDRWSEHFAWKGQRVEPLTAVGRATAEALRLNSDRRLLVREAESRFGLFPP